MANTTVNNIFFDDFCTLNTHTIDLSVEMTQWAAQICQAVENKQEQWKSFLDALAIAGIDEWLHQSALSLEPNYDRQHPPNRDTRLTVGKYKIGIITLGSITDTQVEIPACKALEQMAHMYLLAEVREEANQVVILAGLRQDQLINWLTAKISDFTLENSTENRADRYQIPISAFEIIPEQVLLHLSCLDAAAVQANKSSTLFNQVSTRVINAKLWLEEQLDQVASDLSWALLPPLIPANGMRPIRTRIEDVMELLSSKGVYFPPESRGASGSVTVGQVVCQLYTWVWPVESFGQSEWSLFVLLAPELSDQLPTGIQLQVSDQNSLLATERLAEASDEAYLYVQAQGTQQETFTVRILLPTGQDYVLPAFSFT
ncbi:MAG: DUF1822 family protein [Phormidesmis sp.]